MSNSASDCTTRCWGLAAAIGALTFIVLMTAGERSFVAALFLGILAAVLLGFLFTWLFCSTGKGAATQAPASAPAPTAARGDAQSLAGVAAASGAAMASPAPGASAAAGAATAVGAAPPEPAAPATPEPAEPAAPEAAGTAPQPAASADPRTDAPSRVKPSAALAGEADLDSRKGSWTYERPDADGASGQPAADTRPPAGAAPDAGAADTPGAAAPEHGTGEPASEAGAAAAAGPVVANPAQSVIKPSKPLAGQQDLASRKGNWRYEGGAGQTRTEAAGDAAIPDYDGDGRLEGSDEGSRPAMLDGPRAEGPDNLKEIKGIGPKLEVLCHSLGVYHFDQIAAWSSDEIAWMDANLEGFRGRVSRDQWVDQARILASGGDTEFSTRVDKGGVY